RRGDARGEGTGRGLGGSLHSVHPGQCPPSHGANPMHVFDKTLPSPDTAANRAEIIRILQAWTRLVCDQGVGTLPANPGLLVAFDARTDAIRKWAATYVSQMNPGRLRSLCSMLNQRVRVATPTAQEKNPILWSGAGVLGSGTLPVWNPTDVE